VAHSIYSLERSNTSRYIHANYRFIVKPNGDYKPQAVNADQHLDWNDVLQILASAVSQEASCPICLSHPVAPRMAKCGHIFCLPCLIRYMHSTDDANPVRIFEDQKLPILDSLLSKERALETLRCLASKAYCLISHEALSQLQFPPQRSIANTPII
jgi:hypothetical protein